MRTTENLKVIVSNFDNEVMYIVPENNINLCSMTDCFDDFGLLFLEEEVGCVDIEAITFWDGQNFRSILIGESDYGQYHFADVELAEKVLEEYNDIDYPNYKNGFGVTSLPGGRFVFMFSQYPSDSFNICSVRNS
ncbi:hypothetical protein QUW47_13515 [Phocaeicola barnesiae]|uniref:hypothetical protein n=1 Tax=Phocaeicola barnesiae TaxID=376804 RepID=UPI0025A3BE4A|nr:hypothetical protein [Phocaeicola barnesiae]MDM8242874.1 hypothetical protein [Phocaeicola barnesiae]